MKHFLFLLVVWLASVTHVKASAYYFSTISGNDSRAPFEAKNPATPWKTLEKLNSFFNSLKAGDSVLLKRGETYYGSITINKSGNTFAPLVIGAYGGGNKPVITGFTPLTWKLSGNNIYESQLLSVPTISVLTISGNLTAMGRFPDVGYINFESHNGTSSITDEQLTDAVNWTGAELVLRSRRWILDRNTIIKHTGTTLFYTPSSKYEPRDNYGYFIQNSPLTLSRNGEWYYNPLTKKISLYSSVIPGKVNVATVNTLVNCMNVSYVTLNNLRFEGTSKTAIIINNGSHINVSNCEIAFSGENGLRLNNHADFIMEYCTVINTLNNGVDLGSGCSRAVLSNNVVQNTAVLPGMGLSGDQKGIAIFTKSNNNTIQYNKIINTGYTAIYFAGDSAKVQNNFVDSFCTVKDDGGGIYTYTGTSAPGKGRKILGNIIKNGIGAPAGTDNVKKSEASGIYIDNNASDVDIRYNTVTTCNQYGLYLHNATAITIQDNTFFDNEIQLSMIQNPGNNLVRDNTIGQNVFFANLPTQLVSYLRSGADDTGLFANFSKNYYAKPLENKLVTFSPVFNKGQKDDIKPELEAWKKNYGGDETLKSLASVKGPFRPEYNIRFEYNATQTVVTIPLNGTFSDVKNNKYTDRLVLQPFTSAVLIKGK